MFKMMTQEEFLQKLKNMGVKHIPLEDYKGSSKEIKWMCYKNSKHIFEATPDSVYRNTINNVDGCMYCNHKKVFVGETDMWTTRPDMAAMLLNPEDGYKYFANSNVRVDWICPKCGSIVKDKIINNVEKQGLSCDNCSDGMSFGEKFVWALLVQLNCNFVHDRPTKWSNDKRYDFYIPSMSVIIETHGIQHYKERTLRHFKDRFSRTIKEEIANDKYKMNLALTNNIKYYIQLDCKRSELDYVKQSVINSELKKLFDLSTVDWNECYKRTLTSNVVWCAELWNSGMKRTKDIENYTGIDRCSVVPYLKRAAKIGLCDFELNYTTNQIANNNLETIVSLWKNGITSVSKLMRLSGLSKTTVYKMLKRAGLYTKKQLLKQKI